MKRSAAKLILAVVFLSMLFVTNASAGSVSVSFSGDKNVLPGQTYTYKYDILANDAYGFFIKMSCSNSVISGDTDPYKDCIDANTTVNISGKVYLKINSNLKAGDTITITATGNYNVVDENGIPNDFFNISESYTLTVVSPDKPTPLPTASPAQEPIPTASTDSSPLPSQEIMNTPVPKVPQHAAKKPMNTDSPAMPTENTPETSKEKEVAASPSQASVHSVWDALSLDLDKTNSGGLITLSLDPSAGPLPVSILKAIHAKGCILVINFNEYSCTIESKNLSTTLSKPVDLIMDMTKSAEVSNSVYGKDIYQLHFIQSGDFPGCFKYSFMALDCKPSDTLYLYRYHSSSGLAEYKQCISVDSNSNVEFEIYEGGSYIVTASLLTDNPKTGETITESNLQQNSNEWLTIVVICMACSAATLYAVIRLYQKHRKGNL